ncbi:hypothetical protein FRB94_014407 [Tulasnella sp. JGI-2019a]|nr:hypothetical protein FRB94_014407 [Tulasnella sp. JGI-2019a]KAG9008607.1 hypothetical protein FRB93_006526 [Tulasnella sp. JGI-2019a]KAG9038474.1 hypothetical protein FRB95_001331 [Tulasnella sp. JGI-2019a]
MALPEQYAYRAQKSLGLVGGTPHYETAEGFAQPEHTARLYKYTPDGRLFAIALPNCVRIHNATDYSIVVELPVPNVFEIGFSPKGTYLSTWERYVKPASETEQTRNHRVWLVQTGEEVIAFTQKSSDGWDLQYTPSEDRAVRMVPNEIQIYNPSTWSKGAVDKLRVEGVSAVAPSPGQYPALAVFVAEKKGAPATVKVYSLTALSAAPSCSKTFFKADKAVIKWNNLGTQVLVLTSTEVDKTGKNYYGETNMYLLSSAGNFDCRVTLDKEGPIHDFGWSPNSKEFAVTYGYMPAKTVLFDQRVRTIHDFGTNPRNFLAFNPQGRLFALAGFGNLAGKIDIFDRRSLNKVCEIDAPNTSWCEWSPDGRFLLTATLSPRLRVDNGIKIWHCTGPLMHIHMIEELYQASWRPALTETAPPFGNALPAAPAPSQSVESYKAVKPTPSKPAGAYRPPGARGSSTPSIFKREDEGGDPYSASPSRNGSTTNLAQRGPSRSGSPLPPKTNGAPAPGRGPGLRGRVVPGAPPPGWAPPEVEEKKPSKKKEKKADGAESGPAGAEARRKKAAAAAQSTGPEGVSRKAALAGSNRLGEKSTPMALDLNGAKALPVDLGGNDQTPGIPATPGTAGGEGLDPVQKKIRNLNKKLKAIDELKEKVKKGDKMETTQLKKIEGEADIKKELAAMMAELSVSG